MNWDAKTAMRTTMRALVSTIILGLIALSSQHRANAQDLAPRAYVITPLRTNAVTLSYTYASGDLVFGSAIPITGARGEMSVSTISYYHSMNFLGRSANITLSLPYAVATFRGEVIGTDTVARRSGLIDVVARVSVNLKGAPAMTVDEYRKWRQKTIIGASLKIMAPTGQYDPTKLINPGANRWAFKPEIGLSRRWGNWLLDGYTAVWFFTANHDYFSRNQYSSGTNVQTQKPIGVIEMHLSYDVKPRLWASVDGNYWYGGRTTVNGVESRSSLQANSRIGGTFSVPLNKHQSLKFSYSRGARVRFGGNTDSVAAAWQYSWLGFKR